MANEKLVQSPEDMYEDMYEDLYCEDIHENRVCPLCGSPMQHDGYLSIETGSFKLLMVCCWCGHTE